jgi:hypothetical protein
MKLLGIISMGFKVTHQLLIISFAFVRYRRKKLEYNDTVHHLLVDFKKTYGSFRREVLYNILIEFEVPMKLVRLIKMCSNKTHSKVHIGKHLSDNFPIQNCQTQGDALLPLFSNSA